MQVKLVKDYIGKAVSLGSYIRYPSLNLQGRDYVLLKRINGDYVKGAIELLGKSGLQKLTDIAGDKLKYMVKDDWFSMSSLNTSQRIFLIAYMADALKKEVTFRYGFNQMKPKTLRNFFNAFKTSEYITIICNISDYKKLSPMLTDNKVIAVITQPDNDDVYLRKPIKDAFDEVSESKFIDNIRDYDMFRILPFNTERFNILKNVLWAEEVSERDGYIHIVNPLNELSSEFKQLLELCCRECESMVLKEPDLFLNDAERMMFYQYLQRAKVTYKDIFLSEYK